MKKLLIILILCIAAFHSEAQEKQFSFGVSTGVQMSQLRGNDKDSISTGGYSGRKPGFTIGMYAQSPLGKRFSLKHELSFTHQVYVLKEGTTENTLYKNSIDIFPVSPVFEYAHWQIFAGPYLSILLNGDRYGDNVQQGGYLQKNDMGFTTGIAYTLKNGIQLQLKYVRGFVSLIDNAAKQERWHIYNEYAGFTIGYRLSGL
jgi:hypothetical protein